MVLLFKYLETRMRIGETRDHVARPASSRGTYTGILHREILLLEISVRFQELRYDSALPAL
jgi:hypothetical protein